MYFLNVSLSVSACTSGSQTDIGCYLEKILQMEMNHDDLYVDAIQVFTDPDVLLWESVVSQMENDLCAQLYIPMNLFTQ